MWTSLIYPILLSLPSASGWKHRTKLVQALRYGTEYDMKITGSTSLPLDSWTTEDSTFLLARQLRKCIHCQAVHYLCRTGLLDSWYALLLPLFYFFAVALRTLLRKNKDAKILECEHCNSKEKLFRVINSMRRGFQDKSATFLTRKQRFEPPNHNCGGAKSMGNML